MKSKLGNPGLLIDKSSKPPTLSTPVDNSIAQTFEFVLRKDCEVQRFATRHGNIVKMGLSFLNGSYRLDVRKLALSIARNAWKHNAEMFVTMCSLKNCLNHPENHLLRAHIRCTSVSVPL